MCLNYQQPKARRNCVQTSTAQRGLVIVSKPELRAALFYVDIRSPDILPSSYKERVKISSSGYSFTLELKWICKVILCKKYTCTWRCEIERWKEKWWHNGGNSRIILQIMSMIHDSSIIQQNKLPSKDHLLAFHNPHFVP